jgi:hypothetical protein
MSKNQSHGIDWENAVIKSWFDITKDELNKQMTGGHTASVDIPEGTWNGIFVPKRVQVKTTNNNTIDCSDCRYFYKTIQAGVILSVARYEQQGGLKKIHTVYEFDIEPKHHKIIYDSLTYNQIVDYVDFVRSFKTREEQKTNAKQVLNVKNDLLYYNDGLIGLNPKTTQQRVQCSLKIDQLISEGIPYETYQKEYKGITLPYYIKSSEREFKKNPYEQNSELFFDYTEV